ncbi:glycosyltransferase family 2 protein [Marinobacter salsuginis]|uniref:glycosyltransferase family A protein n=1 Tax=Marinobacter salsuginis TaxID=418719 RepID=UPI001C98B93F|nr:glycosyltransferase family A protein [Marinobacter salsuginis]MBY6070316.1 glycosyltransferase family 2 protein [Marinobacter salsuginis]
MRIGIVIPLKSKRVAKNWDTTTKNLQATVDSVLAQNSENFNAVVVGHDCPEFLNDNSYQNSKCEFLKYSDFEPPVAGEVEAENQLKYEFDRCTKIRRDIIHLRNQYPSITHWFALDADDLLRNDFVKTLENYQDSQVIILDNGYFYFKNSGIINEENEFSTYCGSSAVISDKVFSLPDTVDEKSFKSTPFGNISHVHMKQRLEADGWSISIPSERIIMYVRDNGENISNDAYCNTPYKKFKKIVKSVLRYKSVSKDVKASFGLA